MDGTMTAFGVRRARDASGGGGTGRGGAIGFGVGNRDWSGIGGICGVVGVTQACKHINSVAQSTSNKRQWRMPRSISPWKIPRQVGVVIRPDVAGDYGDGDKRQPDNQERMANNPTLHK